jgi:hypothetical protein
VKGAIESFIRSSSDIYREFYKKFNRALYKEAALCGAVWCGLPWFAVILWCGLVWFGMVWCSLVWLGVIWCGLVLFGFGVS